MADGVHRLDEAMAARSRGDWGTAYDVLSAVRASEGLDAESLYALGDAAWWLGLVRETIEVCEECHQSFLEEGRVDRAAMMALETAFHWMMRGEPEIGSGWLSRGRRLLEGQPTSIGHGFLLLMEAQGRLAGGDLDGALAGGRELQRMADDLTQPVLRCFGLVLEGLVAVRGGEVERGFELLDEAMLPVLAGTVPPSEAGNLYCVMISISIDLADLARARRWTEATERWCDTFTEAVMFAGICRVHRAQLLRAAGSWDEALAAATAACRDLADLNVEAAAEAHYEIGETLRLRGDLGEARTAYDAAARLGRVPEPGRALLLLDEGRHEAAAAAVRRALAEQADLFRRARLLAAQVEIACARGDHVAAKRATAELEEIAATYGSPGFRAWAHTARAAVLVGCGTPDEAVAPLRSALATYRAMGAGYDEAMTRALLGRALAAGGDAAAAETQTSAARDALVEMGARRRAEALAEAEARVGPLGRPPGRPAAPGGLTEREWQVVCAVTEGLSNREVAARLVISEKTVARHLANVFAKIDVSSRTAAAAWAHEHGGPG